MPEDKAAARLELERLTKQFLENGGTIQIQQGRFESGDTEPFTPKPKPGRKTWKRTTFFEDD